MATTAAEPIFIDTNVLVFASLPLSSLYATAIAAIHEIDKQGAPVWISRQIVREYLVQVTRPGVVPGGTQAAIAAEVARFSTMFHIADETDSTTAALLDLVRTFGVSGKSIHDANIVATMQTHGIRRLLTHNVADFKRYSSLITVVPLQP